jgi:sorbose reductase
MTKMSETTNENVHTHNSAVLSLFSLAGKVAIVTGAGAGIGLAVAEAFAEAGAKAVVIWYHSNIEGPEKARAISDKYGTLCMIFFFFLFLSAVDGGDLFRNAVLLLFEDCG